MAKHEFGIMPAAPQKGQRYDDYLPQKYNCITVDDRHIENLDLEHIDFFWHTLDDGGKGLAYCGVTLIPPEAIPQFIAAIDAIPALSELESLLQKALAEGRWVIHFGL